MGVIFAVTLWMMPACEDTPGYQMGVEGGALSGLETPGSADWTTIRRPAVLTRIGYDGDKPPSEEHSNQASPEAARDLELGLSWHFSPDQLQVYRSTAVALKTDRLPAGHERAECVWNFGDGTPLERGCEVSHTFHGGQSDQLVTLTLEDGDWSYETSRRIPLERLEVVHGLLDGDGGTSQTIPGLPADTSTSFRFAVVADTSALIKGAEQPRALHALVDTVSPELVIHVGGFAHREQAKSGFDDLNNMLLKPLRDAGVSVAWALGPNDLTLRSSPDKKGLQIVDAKDFPERYSFTHKGSFFLVFATDAQQSVTEDTLEWMRNQLAAARVYEGRYVLSYLPLHKFGEEHLGSLDKKFRLYELFLRSRVSAFFSAGYSVYFKGRYGALPVVSVGAISGTGGRLSGHDFSQNNSFVVVDVIKGTPERIFAVDGPDFVRPFDEKLLPASVEVYTR